MSRDLERASRVGKMLGRQQQAQREAKRFESQTLAPGSSVPLSTLRRHLQRRNGPAPRAGEEREEEEEEEGGGGIMSFFGVKSSEQRVDERLGKTEGTLKVAVEEAKTAEKENEEAVAELRRTQADVARDRESGRLVSLAQRNQARRKIARALGTVRLTEAAQAMADENVARLRSEIARLRAFKSIRRTQETVNASNRVISGAAAPRQSRARIRAGRNAEMAETGLQDMVEEAGEGASLLDLRESAYGDEGDDQELAQLFAECGIARPERARRPHSQPPGVATQPQPAAAVASAEDAAEGARAAELIEFFDQIKVPEHQLDG